MSHIPAYQDYPSQVWCHQSLQQTQRQTTHHWTIQRNSHCAFEQLTNMSTTALLPMTQLHTPACQTHILRALSSNSLLRIGIFPDNWYVTIFHDGNKGATIHDRNDITITSSHPAILQGWQDDKGLWHIPLTKPHSIRCDTALHCINNVFDLPSMAQTVHYFHAALSFPTKTTYL